MRNIIIVLHTHEMFRLQCFAKYKPTQYAGSEIKLCNMDDTFYSHCVLIIVSIGVFITAKEGAGIPQFLQLPWIISYR